MKILERKMMKFEEERVNVDVENDVIPAVNIEDNTISAVDVEGDAISAEDAEDDIFLIEYYLEDTALSDDEMISVKEDKFFLG
jgi:hypothetical protein